MLLKLEHLSPSGSFKDRGMSVLASLARRHEVSRVVCDSSGNAGSSIATYCAAAGIPCDVYAPESTSPGKLAQIRAMGARVVLVPGGRDEASKAAQDAADNAFYASHYWNPYFFEGTKTFAYEVFEQLDRVMPEHVVCPVGHGSLYLGMVQGFHELARITGLTAPRCHAVQAEGFDPVVRAVTDVTLEQRSLANGQDTIAEGIRIRHPLRLETILNGLASTRGEAISVTDMAIQGAFEGARLAGILLEPTSAVALAGVVRLRSAGVIEPEDQVLVPITGNGLKTLHA